MRSAEAYQLELEFELGRKDRGGGAGEGAGGVWGLVRGRFIGFRRRRRGIWVTCCSYEFVDT